jgi:hypothetical protein
MAATLPGLYNREGGGFARRKGSSGGCIVAVNPSDRAAGKDVNLGGHDWAVWPANAAIWAHEISLIYPCKVARRGQCSDDILVISSVAPPSICGLGVFGRRS